MFWISFAIFLVCLLAESLTSWWFIRGSKRMHPKLWEDAGCPTLMGNGDLISSWHLVRYVSRREYRFVDDVDAVSFADRLRGPLAVSYWAAVVSVVVFFALLFLGLSRP